METVDVKEKCSSSPPVCVTEAAGLHVEVLLECRGGCLVTRFVYEGG